MTQSRRTASTLEVLADLRTEVAGDTSTVMRLLVNACATARRLTPPWPVDLPEDSIEHATKRLTDIDDLAAWGAAELGDAYQALLTADDRASGGVYYTPPELARFVTLLALYTQRDHVPDALVYDPSCGAGVFLLAAARQLAVERASQFTGANDPLDFAVASVLGEVLAETVFGTDIDPVAVEVAKSACWLEVGGVYPITWLDDNIIVADPLAGHLPPALAARLDDGLPLIVLGNPPYLEMAKGKAPWIEARRRTGLYELRPSLDEFRAPGKGRYEGKLSNLYVYFWRLATWLAFDRRPRPGTVAYVTPSAYLTSHAYAGMRAYLRRAGDRGWVVDVSPEGNRADIPTRIFPEVKTPLAIGVFARSGCGNPERPADVRHATVQGKRADKLAALESLLHAGEAP